MKYTQLAFAPWSPKRPELFQQAGFLVRELVYDRAHPFPCDCGACIYRRFRESEKAEGRPFSKHTFFMFFLRADMFGASVVAPLPTSKDRDLSKWVTKRYKWLKQAAGVQRLEVAFKKDLEREPGILSTDIYVQRLKRSTRKKTLGMIKELAQRERGRHVRQFLARYLSGKNFYVYYKKADNNRLRSTVAAIRRELNPTPPPRPARVRPAHATADAKTGTPRARS
jgi:hypothetical protein